VLQFDIRMTRERGEIENDVRAEFRKISKA